MGNDDLTRDIANIDEDGKDTQPTITAVFRLLQSVQTGLSARLDETESRISARLDETESRFNARLDETESRFNARLDKTDARLDEVETRLSGDIAGLNNRVVEGFKEVTHKINALNRRSLQQEADYEDLSERIGRLESKAS